MWLPDGEKFVDSLFSRFDTIPACDGQKDRQTSCRVDCRERLLMMMADVMAADGYLDAGYEYVTVDDCWLANTRDKDGRLQPDPIRFPRGMKHLADYVSVRPAVFASWFSFYSFILFSGRL